MLRTMLKKVCCTCTGVFFMVLGLGIIAVASASHGITDSQYEAAVAHPADVLPRSVILRTCGKEAPNNSYGNMTCGWGGATGTCDANNTCVCRRNWHHDVYMVAAENCSMPTYWPWFSAAVIIVIGAYGIGNALSVVPEWVRTTQKLRAKQNRRRPAWFNPMFTFLPALLSDAAFVVAFVGYAAGEPRIFYVSGATAVFMNAMVFYAYLELLFPTFQKLLPSPYTKHPRRYDAMRVVIAVLNVVIPCTALVVVFVLTAKDSEFTAFDWNSAMVAMFCVSMIRGFAYLAAAGYVAVPVLNDVYSSQKLQGGKNAQMDKLMISLEMSLFAQVVTGIAEIMFMVLVVVFWVVRIDMYWLASLMYCSMLMFNGSLFLAGVSKQNNARTPSSTSSQSRTGRFLSPYSRLGFRRDTSSAQGRENVVQPLASGDSWTWTQRQTDIVRNYIALEILSEGGWYTGEMPILPPELVNLYERLRPVQDDDCICSCSVGDRARRRSSISQTVADDDGVACSNGGGDSGTVVVALLPRGYAEPNMSRSLDGVTW